MTIFPRLISAEPFIQENLEAGYAHADLDTALKRIRTGCRVTWVNGKWLVFDGQGVCWGGYEDRKRALLVYQLCCSLADLPPSEHLQVNWGAGKP